MDILKVEEAMENGQFSLQLRSQKAFQKLWKAYLKLRQQQIKTQNEITPKYPFVYEKSPHELLVHLGQIHLPIVGRDHLIELSNQLQYQSMMMPYYPLNITKMTQESQQPLDQKDSKNIAKNYCKAIMTFALKNQEICQLLFEIPEKVIEFLQFLDEKKREKLNIRVFSNLLLNCERDQEFNRAFRILSWFFIRKEAIGYVFNSKIQQISWHIRYRHNVLKGIQNPKNFSKIKNL